MISDPQRKPRIRRVNGEWHCSSPTGYTVATGKTPKDAYRTWRRINDVMSRWHDHDPDRNAWQWNDMNGAPRHFM